MTYQLQRVSQGDLPVMYALLVLCGEHMHRTLGLSHWYPFRPYDIFLQQIDVNEVYAIYSDEVLAGTFALNPQPRPYYQAHMWAQPEAKALYFGMFGVLPTFQKQGIGRWASQQADHITHEKGYAAMRFDAIANHPKLLKFYDGLGYERRGVLSLSNGRDIVCYERTFEGQ
jgi:GNAT superfamily N-acetyltransferase